MVAARLVIEHDMVVELDYGQFCLHTGEDGPELSSEVLSDALDGDGIGQRGGVVVVTSPHQNNFEMKFRVEVWSAAPTSDLSAWQEAFEVHLDVDEYGVVYESPTLDFENLGVPPGAYHAQITGRGFITHGWPGSTEPGDEWRLRLWPAGGPAGPTRLSAFVEPHEQTAPAVVDTDQVLISDSTSSVSQNVIDGNVDARRVAAQEAGLRIYDDLGQNAGARALSGRLGTASIDIVLPRTAKSVWPLLANLDVTRMSGPRDLNVGNEFSMMSSNMMEDGFVGRDGHILCRWVELQRPARVVLSWAWMWTSRPDMRRIRRFPDDATLTFTLTDVDTSPSAPRTRLVLTHAGIPHEWTDDMSAIWRSRVDIWMYQSR